ncbi:hypothetical protein DC522_05915 [Microvirga sp. KLBC 81]|uniref:hypothetical protein n=1 Tax=Microvirga sp. KLBC 81 TaxID=1862707 RepID=UPI000D51EF11|nr:hypothetical protein [Microvirga sp. KLBC 81]PVE25429.1 hypothetical protein DC522_05915 [Microvirga sp. KLBC 81]
MGARGYNFDKLLQLKDAGAVAASAAAQVGGSNQILDMGAARFDAVARINVSAITVGADNAYDIIVQGSNSATFASGIENLASLNLGNTAVRDGGAQTSTTGIYELPVTNEQADTVYRYVRIYTKVAGTTPSINFDAFLTTPIG